MLIRSPHPEREKLNRPLPGRRARARVNCLDYPSLTKLTHASEHPQLADGAGPCPRSAPGAALTRQAHLDLPAARAGLAGREARSRRWCPIFPGRRSHLPRRTRRPSCVSLRPFSESDQLLHWPRSRPDRQIRGFTCQQAPAEMGSQELRSLDEYLRLAMAIDHSVSH
jgi:hypothetical protein